MYIYICRNTFDVVPLIRNEKGPYLGKAQNCCATAIAMSRCRARMSPQLGHGTSPTFLHDETGVLINGGFLSHRGTPQSSISRWDFN